MRSVERSEHDKWYRICPNLAGSYCCSLLTTICFFIFLPVLLILGPLFSIIFYVGFFIPYEKTRCGRRTNCCVTVMMHLLFLLILLPFALAFGMIVAVIVAAIAILPLYYYTLVHLGRLIYIGCKYKI